MKKGEVIELYHGLNAFKQLLEDDVEHRNVKLTYAICLTIKMIDPIVEKFDAIMYPTQKFLEFNSRQMEIINVFAKKDEDGKFVTRNNGTEYQVDDMDGYMEGYNALVNEFGEDIANEPLIKKDELEAVKSEELEFELPMIPLSEIPELKGLSPKIMDQLLPIISIEEK